jgi:hypothetical protein
MLCNKEYETLRMINHAYLHSIMKYGIILGGNSPGAKMFSFYRRKLQGQYWEQSIKAHAGQHLKHYIH